MKVEKSHISRNYKALRYWYNIIWSVLLILILAYLIWSGKLKFDFQDYKEIAFSLIIIAIGIIAVRDTFHMLFGGLKITLSKNALISEKNNGFSTKRTEYILERIKALQVNKNTFNGYRWNWGGLVAHDTDKEILTFQYDDKNIVLGKKIMDFDASELKNHILRKKTKHNKA